MSRCFPFPPPGFAGKCLSDEALIVSIKLQRENEKANTDRKVENKSKSSDRDKEKKREKKEKKRQKKENKRQDEGRAHFSVDGEKQILAEKLLQADKHKVASKHKGSIRGHEPELLLDKSSVTEEHGLPTDLQNVSCSSDSTGNSSKRKIPSTSPGGLQSNGSIIRIRLSSTHNTDEPSTSGCKEQEISLPPQKTEDPSTSSYNKIRPCSNLARRTLLAMKQKDAIVESPQNITNFASTSNATTSQLTSRQDKEVMPGLAKKIESTPPREKLSSHVKRPCSNLERAGSSKKQKDAITKASPRNETNLSCKSNATTTFQLTSRKDMEVVPCLAKKIESAPPREKLSSHEKRPSPNLVRAVSSMKQKDAIIKTPPQNEINLSSTSNATTFQPASRQDKEVVPCLAKKIESAPPRETLSSMKQKDAIIKAPQNITNLSSASNASTFQLASRQDKEVAPCLGKKIESVPPREKLSSHEKRVLKRESHYKKLLNSWTPPPVQSEVVVNNGTHDDEEWLFGRKDEEWPAKRSKVGDLESSEGNFPRCASSAMQPRAMFLSDAQVYALPFTVPF